MGKITYLGDTRLTKLERDIPSMISSGLKVAIDPVYEEICSIIETLKHFERGLDALSTT